jgi:hypothetical protein
VAELTPQDMAAKLLASGFERSGPSAAALSDPIADTPMVVTLDQLRPYDHDPRVTRNPAYEDIKASIRERGLDAPPRSRAGRRGALHHPQRRQHAAGDPARAVERDQGGTLLPHCACSARGRRAAKSWR